jgi:hypothetical protein
MDKTIQHINKLFKSAKSQEPVISEDFARTLLEKRALGSPDMYHIPKGVKFMNLISSLAIAASSICLFTVTKPTFNNSFADNTVISKQINKNNSSMQVENQVNQVNNVINDEITERIQDTNTTINVIKNTSGSSTIADTNYYFPAVDITGINPVKLSEAELEQIGFTVEKGGHISFYNGDTNSQSVLKTTILSPWGLDITEINKSDTEFNQIHKLNSQFRFICDQDGNKRLSVFNSGNMKMMVSKSMLRKNYLNNSDEHDETNRAKDFTNIDTFNCNPQSIITLLNSNNLNSNSIQSSDLSISPDSIKSLVQSLINNNSEINNKQFSVSIASSDFSGNMMLNDSNDSVLHKIIINNFQIFNSDNSDSLLTDLLPTNIINIDDLENENEINLNELLPIEVDLKDVNGNPYIKNGVQQKFIIWFEPTLDFIAQLPDAVKSKLSPELEAIPDSYESCPKPPVTGERTHFDIWRSCSGAIENLKVYPVPAKDFLTYKYNLASDRNVSLYICNLNGEILANPISNANISSSCIEERVDVGFLQPGMYLLVVASDIGEKAVQRFIVQ